MAKRQLARVEQLLDEVNILKEEYWTLYKEIQDKVIENKRKLKAWEKAAEDVKKKLKTAELAYQTERSKENRSSIYQINDIITFTETTYPRRRTKFKELSLCRIR